MASHGMRCHGGTRRAAGLSLSTQAGVQPPLTAIDLAAAAGPSNKSIPQGGASPSRAERQQLGEWRACGAN